MLSCRLCEYKSNQLSHHQPFYPYRRPYSSTYSVFHSLSIVFPRSLPLVVHVVIASHLNPRPWRLPFLIILRVQFGYYPLIRFLEAIPHWNHDTQRKHTLVFFCMLAQRIFAPSRLKLPITSLIQRPICSFKRIILQRTLCRDSGVSADHFILSGDINPRAYRILIVQLNQRVDVSSNMCFRVIGMIANERVGGDRFVSDGGGLAELNF